MDITLKVDRVTVLKTRHCTDKVYLHFTNSTPFPVMGDQGSAAIEVQAGYGEEWIKTVLGVSEYEVVDTEKCTVTKVT